MPVIKVFILTYNEADIIRLTINYYKSFCSEIYVYDNHSTDNTVEICKEMGCHVELFGSSFFDDRYNVHIKNNAWKSHRDADEIVSFNYKEVADIYKCVGYNMYSEDMPAKWNFVNMGVPSEDYCKPAVFNPNTVLEMNYGYGCHGAKPIINGKYIIDKESATLRHMRYIGGVDRMISRYRMYKSRMSEFNLHNNFGYQYQYDIEKIKLDWENIKRDAKEVIY